MLKPGKPAAEPSSYHPLCMLDTAGKILERIMTILSTAQSAVSGKRWNRGTKKYCTIITLDVRNAFTSARWDKILTTLSQMEVPAYLQRMVSNYFRGRVLEFTTDDGAETYEITAGVPQRSVLGPILLNVMYDRILRLELPRSAKIVGFADDIAIMVVAKHLDLVKFYSNEAIRLVLAALTELGLQTADQKTEVLLVTSRKVTETITVRAGDHYITSAPCIRYLGMHIDAKLRFEEHLRIVSDKANRVAGALLGLMPNIGGPRSSRRRLYASVVDSILLYGAPAWSEVAKKQSYARWAASIHRRACLRVICCFCSISHEATYVLANIPPLTLLIDERSRLYSRRFESAGSDE
uniref:Reverse transcriptase domain-containing protein n=1 Tax=Trichogramma kaykai TaxID=54128 RepID=A0ABD2WZY3_9HYME